MLETALGADLERFGNAQLQLLRLTPAQGSLLPDGRTDPNAKSAAAGSAAAAPPAPVAAPAAPLLPTASTAAGAEAGGLLTAPSGITDLATAGSGHSLAAVSSCLCSAEPVHLKLPCMRQRHNTHCIDHMAWYNVTNDFWFMSVLALTFCDNGHRTCVV